MIPVYGVITRTYNELEIVKMIVIDMNKSNDKDSNINKMIEALKKFNNKYK